MFLVWENAQCTFKAPKRDKKFTIFSKYFTKIRKYFTWYSPCETKDFCDTGVLEFPRCAPTTILIKLGAHRHFFAPFSVSPRKRFLEDYIPDRKGRKCDLKGPFFGLIFLFGQSLSSSPKEFHYGVISMFKDDISTKQFPHGRPWKCKCFTNFWQGPTVQNFVLK